MRLNSIKFAMLVFLLFLVPALSVNGRVLDTPGSPTRPSSASDEILAIKKWDAQALKEISAAKTLSEVLVALNFTRKNSEARKLGNRKWSTLFSDELIAAKNSVETRATLDRARSEDERWNAVVMVRELLGDSISSEVMRALYGEPIQQKQWDARALEDVVNAETLREIRKTYARARDDSPARKLAIIKASKFLPSE